MKVIFVNVSVALPRILFDRRLEMSRYCDMVSVLGWVSNNSKELNAYINETHRIVKLCKSKTQETRFKARFNELMFVLKAISFLGKNEADLVVIDRQRFAFLYPLLLPKVNMAVSSYLNAVNQSKLERKFHYYLRKIIMSPFDNILLPHQYLVEYFGLSKKNTYVVNWGQKPISDRPKEFVALNLLYIGSISGRKVDETLTGLDIFLKKYQQDCPIQYHIIGSGKREVIDKILELIKEYGLEGNVFYHGRLSDDEVKYFFDMCNVGISYVPITGYYTDLHVTKTDEYLLSGLAVLATATNYNKSVINDKNGVLIKDNPSDFALGLKLISERFSQYDSKSIVKGVEEKTSKYLVKNRIIPVMEDLVKKYSCKKYL